MSAEGFTISTSPSTWDAEAKNAPINPAELSGTSTSAVPEGS